MKRVFFVSMVILSVIMMSCRKDPPTLPEPKLDPTVEPVQPSKPPTPYKDGVLFFDGMKVKSVAIPEEDRFPMASSNFSIPVKNKSGVKMAEYEAPEECRVNSYWFMKVAQEDALIVTLEGENVPVQATHVKISDKYAYVSYNLRGEPNIGGLVVYEYTVKHGTKEEATVEIRDIASLRLSYSQINAIDFDGSKLYLAGATELPEKFFGKTEREDRAFLMVLELNSDGTLKEQEPIVKQLTSYQATSIRKYNGRIYITVGDGTDGPPPSGNWNNLMDGGLFVYDADNYKFITHILGLVHARSVDVDDNFVYLYQANHTRVSKFSHNNLTISGKITLYEDIDEAMQRDAKSEMIVWNNYLLVAENETGLRMLFKETGRLNQAVRPPNSGSERWNCDSDVTNSMSINSDLKKNCSGNDVQSDLLLVANGEQGIAWYDITKPINNPNGKDWIYGSNFNKILDGEGSANYVTSRGNVAFVADGTGGLKVLYIGFNPGDVDFPVGQGCTKFMEYIYDRVNGANITSLFPEAASVFRSNAHYIVKQLFQDPSRTEASNVALKYIEIQKETPLYITYQSEGAGWNNALGYFVIPENVPQNDAAEFEYWEKHVKPNLCTTVTVGGHPYYILKEEHIIFQYIREEGDRGGSLVPGNIYQIGGEGKTFKPKERVVLFMCPDGYSTQNDCVLVTYDPGLFYQIFFTHKYFNLATKIPYSPLYSNGSDSFAGEQFNTFYSADCKSMVFLVEDWHVQGSDVDFNDLIFSVSDNIEEKDITSFVIPYWAVGKNKDGVVEIFPSSDLF